MQLGILKKRRALNKLQKITIDMEYKIVNMQLWHYGAVSENATLMEIRH
jgi:hypothetical protein